MKIKASESRLGNLVEFEGRVFQIDSISDSLPTLNTPEFGIGVVDWNNIKPIELTPDWLLRLGFEGDDDGEEFYHKDSELFGVQFCLFEKEDVTHVWDGAFTEAPIKYVHQLQNLFFALTGQELILKEK
jgi:hypothetical protein